MILLGMVGSLSLVGGDERRRCSRRFSGFLVEVVRVAGRSRARCGDALGADL